MKKLLYILFTIQSLVSFSQKDYSRYYNSWRLGLNIGAAWQTADYRSCWGMAGGITLEKGFHENNTNFFSFAIRGRYLAANTYGMDYNRNYNVKTNDAYNGKYNPKVNFVDSVSSGKQYVYDNYKMTLGEGALELQLTFNRLRERTHVLLNLWGGVGFTSYKTSTNLLDAAGKMYDFSLIDSTGNQTKALNTYNGLIDEKYESDAFGSKNGNLITFSPSAGIGLGYQFSPGFSMLFEYKITLPQGANADLLDGKLNVNNDVIGGSNDYYHYAGLGLLFTLRSKKKTKNPTIKEETVYTNTVAPSVVPPPVITNPVPPTNTVVAYMPPKSNPISAELKPIISFITPSTNGQSVSNQGYKISAEILNITKSNQIQIKFNGVSFSNFNYNLQSQVLEFVPNLITGNNTIEITATNASGTDNKITTLIYEIPKVSVNPPVITIINPSNCSSVVTSSAFNFKATISNVVSKSNIIVKVNNTLTGNFSFNSATGQLDLPMSLNQGNNSVNIYAANNFGKVSKDCSINFTLPKQTGALPIITYINPLQPGFVSTNISYTVKAQVLNVVDKNSVSVYFNEMSVPFTYNLVTKEVAFSANLSAGKNTISITANNAFGEDTKVTDVMYQTPIEIKNPPVVTITNPSSGDLISFNSNYVFKANITNTQNSNGLVVKFNGNTITNFTYDGVNLSYPATLISGKNTIEVTATNKDGSNTKTGIIIYKAKVLSLLPVVNLINPSSSTKVTSDVSYDFKFSVLYVNDKSNVEVTFNGVAQNNFTFDTISKQVFFKANLSVGQNTVSVKGTNPSGSDFKQVVVTYIKSAAFVRPPLITFIKPASASIGTLDETYSFSASILNMSNNIQGIVVKYNGLQVSNYTFDGLNFNYTSNLNRGTNTLEISATNSAGNDVKSVNVSFRAKPADSQPTINIITPSGSPTVKQASYNFQFEANNVTQTQLEVSLNGVKIPTFDFINSKGNFTANLNTGNNVFSVKATNSSGTVTKTANVVYLKSLSAGNINKPITLPVDTVKSAVSTDTTKKITICHLPPGNKENPQTITIPLSAWQAHLRHGDTMGACPDKSDNIKVKTPQKDSLNKQPINIPRRPK